MRTEPDPTDKTDRSVLITIENTGLQMTNAAFNELTTPLITTKAAGHGLGVPIAIAIAEASGGSPSLNARRAASSHRYDSCAPARIP